MTPQVIPSPLQAPEGATIVSRLEVVRKVLAASEKGQPFSVIRLGEGEARLLAAEASNPLSVDIARRKIKRQTGVKVSDADVFRIKSTIISSIEGSDVIGVLGDESFNIEHQEWAHIATKLVYEHISANHSAKFICHCLVNGNLHSELDRISEKYSYITVITCRNVESEIRSIAPGADIRVLQIPSQFVKRDLDDDYERRVHSTRMWPEAYNKLLGTKLVRVPGELVLIGAGLFGKSLCAFAKSQGGIALDLGSRLDFMVGKRTRGAG